MEWTRHATWQKGSISICLSSYLDILFLTRNHYIRDQFLRSSKWKPLCPAACVEHSALLQYAFLCVELPAHRFYEDMYTQMVSESLGEPGHADSTISWRHCLLAFPQRAGDLGHLNWTDLAIIARSRIRRGELVKFILMAILPQNWLLPKFKFNVRKLDRIPLPISLCLGLCLGWEHDSPRTRSGQHRWRVLNEDQTVLINLSWSLPGHAPYRFPHQYIIYV